MLIPQLTRLFGAGRLLLAALAVIAIGLVWMSLAGPNADYWQVALPMALIGLGNGTAMTPLTAAGVRGVEPRDQGAASGLVNVAHQLGGSLGLSVLIVVFAASASPTLSGVEQIGHEISAVLVGAAVMNVIALVLAAVFILPAGRTTHPVQALAD
jgi:hypothetical protein